ncbi:MAG: DUF294 nucleotidyltransferase-like domain-containing protein [Leptonema sp. (in: bacteria)]
MTAESLKQRIVDFIIKYPPFHFITEEDLLKIASSCKVKLYSPKEFIFREGENPLNQFYVINQGSVQLILEETDEVIEVLEEGDLFGIAALLAKRLYIFSAQAIEETILYVFPFNIFKPYIHKYPRVLRYFSSGFSSGMHHLKKKKLDLSEEYKVKKFISHDEILELKVTKNVVTAKPEDTIQEIAQIMSQRNIGSIIIVNEKQHPIGIITDSDLRKKVATGKYSITARVKEIMTSPVITFKPNINAAEAIVEMMKRNIRHLCLTEQGTPDSKLKGIISEHDLLVLHGNNPAVLVKEIQNSSEVENLVKIRDRTDKLLKDYIEQELSISFISNIVTEINDALIEKAIEFSINKLQKEGYKQPEVPFAWISLGSEGRKEQMLRTDQDNAIVFKDTENNKEVQEYFLKLGESVNEILMQCKFSECPGNIMARNKEWCQPVSKWKEYFKKWMELPDEKNLLNVTIFFDFRNTYGDDSLIEELRDFITVNKNKFFIGFLAKNAVSTPPPLNFFRNLIVEKSGEHKNEFDLKTRCLLPLVDAARVLCIDKNFFDSPSTLERYKFLKEEDPANKELYEEAMEAFSYYLKLRTVYGLKNNNSGRYIQPDELSKMDKQLLRNSFQVVESIQKLLNTQYQLDFIR